MKTKEVTLSKLFHFPPIKGVTKKFILDNHGDIPVYGGRKTGIPVGFLADNLEQVKYFENCLGWNRQGSVGYVFFHNHKFTTTDDHRPMILKNNYIHLVDLNYLQMVIQNKLLSLGFEWSKTAGKNKIKDIKVEIPICEDGSFDLEKQKQLYSKHRKVIDIQEKLADYRDRLNQLFVRINSDEGHFSTVYLSNDELFWLDIGERVLKSEIQKTGIPVYSANVYEPFGYVNYTILSDFSLPSLIWGIDGNFNWNYIPKNVPFMPTDHCGVLRVLNKNILPEYIYFDLQNKKDVYAFDRTYRASLKRIKGVSVDIPIDSQGNYDIERQKDIVNKHKRIEHIRNGLVEKLHMVTSLIVD